MTQRLVIIEPNLRTVGGHCYDYVRVIAREARDAGIEVQGAFHADARDEVTALGMPFTRSFHRSAPAPEQRTGLGRVAVALMGEQAANTLRRVMLGAPATEDEAALTRVRSFADELAEVLAGAQWTAGVRAYFPTVFWPEAAIVAQQSRAITDKGAALSVCLRFDPPEGVEGRAILRQAAESNRAIDWCADTDQLAAAYADILGAPVRTIRIPIDLEALAERLPRRTAPPPVRIAFIGESRREKGFHLLPDVIARVLWDDSSEVVFDIQVLEGEAPMDGAVRAAVTRLKEMAGPRLNVHFGALGFEAFHDALTRAHVILLPYAPEAYARRSSSLLVEGLAAGLAIVAPSAPSWLRHAIEHEGATRNAFWFDGGAEALTDALKEAVAAVRAGALDPPRRPACAVTAPAPWTEAG